MFPVDIEFYEKASNNEWLNSIMKTDESLGYNQKQGPKIQKVPEMLREIDSNKKCYDPLVVSIGPYHHGESKLQAVENLKPLIAKQFVLGSEKLVDEFYRKVVEVAGDARNCYAEFLLNDTEFKKMMFLDGCFVLQFIYCCVNNNFDKMKMKTHITAYVVRDLFLLENQLPFRVLETLMSLRFKDNDGKEMIKTFVWGCHGPRNPLKKSILELICCQFVGGPKMKDVDQFEERSPVHLLEILWGHFIDPMALKKPVVQSSWSSYRSAKELRTVGIHLGPSRTHCFTNVEFVSNFLYAKLTLPRITIDDSTKSMLLNLKAYETCPDASDEFRVTSYVGFMDSLIDNPEDVKELRSNGILSNLLGSDEQVAGLFNEIANDLVPNPKAYSDVKMQIEEHYNNRFKIWVAEWLHNHFSSPWTIIAFFGAISAIALSFIQTYYAVHPRGE